MGVCKGVGVLFLGWQPCRMSLGLSIVQEYLRDWRCWLHCCSLCLRGFVIWCGAGLENSLYGFLLAMGMWRVLIEAEDAERYPISALLFCLVSMTRPEGMMYAFLAGVAMTVFAIVDRRWQRIPIWAGVFLVPFGLYQWWRYEYFGWAYPNTYYANWDLGTDSNHLGGTFEGGNTSLST